MTSDEGLNAYGAATWGQFFIYQGFNARAGWMHTSSGVDNVDEFAETSSSAAARLLPLRQASCGRYRNGGDDRAIATRTARSAQRSFTT